MTEGKEEKAKELICEYNTNEYPLWIKGIGVLLIALALPFTLLSILSIVISMRLFLLSSIKNKRGSTDWT